VKLIAPALTILVWVVIFPTSSPRSEAPEIHPPQLERRIFDLVNKQRLTAKRPAMTWDERLARIARAHSEDMVRRRFFDHINPDGDDPTARGKRAGYSCLKTIDVRAYREGLAENLFDEPRFSRVRISGAQRTYDWNTTEDIAGQSVDGWMHSSGHRRNILEKTYQQTGVGIASSVERVYITQLFC
jgi:uncharacterized protein YkwD